MKMVVVKVPLCVDIVDGLIGLSTDNYIYVIVKRRRDKLFRIALNTISIHDSADAIAEGGFRATLKDAFDMKSGIDISVLPDIRIARSGIDANPPMIVGLIHALSALSGIDVTPDALLRLSFGVSKRIYPKASMHDHIMAVYGGIRRNAERNGEWSSIELSPTAGKSLCALSAFIRCEDAISLRDNGKEEKENELRSLDDLIFSRVKQIVESRGHIHDICIAANEIVDAKYKTLTRYMASEVYAFRQFMLKNGAALCKPIGNDASPTLLCTFATNDYLKEACYAQHAKTFGFSEKGSAVVFTE